MLYKFAYDFGKHIQMCAHCAHSMTCKTIGKAKSIKAKIISSQIHLNMENGAEAHSVECCQQPNEVTMNFCFQKQHGAFLTSHSRVACE